MNQQTTAPIIIIRKKGGHAAHHGGAWKVAYADFVTAMMALFIVLWLMNTSDQVKKAISVYFTDPSGTGKQTGSASAGTGEAVSVDKDNMADLKAKLEAAIKKSPELAKLKEYVQMTVTGEGLRVELIESERGMFFNSGSPKPSELGEELILRLAQELSKLPNQLLIEGHTDSRPYSSDNAYSNWELSTDRANAARRVMEGSGGLPAGRISQVRGFADRNLRDKEHPEDASNRRISVIVRYQDTARVEPAADGKKAPEAEKTSAEKSAVEKSAKDGEKKSPEPAKK